MVLPYDCLRAGAKEQVQINKTANGPVKQQWRQQQLLLPTLYHTSSDSTLCPGIP
jgi:hypothetical protein